MSNWKQRVVAFIVSDSHHSITPINITMNVRTKERTEDGTVYEGPINATWEKRVRPRLSGDGIRGPDLVGVLIASDESLSAGRISWLQQSETTTVEAGEQ